MRDFIRRVLENNAGFEVVRELNSLQELSASHQVIDENWIFVVLAPVQKIPNQLMIESLLKNPSVKIVGIWLGEDRIQAEWVTRHEKDLTDLNLGEFVQFLEQELNDTRNVTDKNGGA